MKVLVTGGTGLVGRAIEKIEKNDKYIFIYLSSKDGDLRNYSETKRLFELHNPDYVIHLAANVGGLYKNIKFKEDMLLDNLNINMNVLKCCHIFNIKKCISILSTCIFPDNIEYPINETKLHNGPPHSSNYAYAYSKRILDVQSQVYREQFNKDFICLIPTNIYGPNDNFNLENSHVIPGLIHKCYLSKISNTKMIVKGTGKPLRQFLFSEDLAKIIMLVLETDKKIDNLIVSPKYEISIKSVAEKINKIMKNNDDILFDSSFSDGQFKKTSDNSKLLNFFPNFKFTDIEEGLDYTIKWFNNNYFKIRK